MKRLTWAAGAAVSAIAVAAPLLVAAPASAAGCTLSSPAPTLNTPNPTTAQQWTQITLTGTSPAVCGKLQVQRQVGTSPWTTITGINPQSVSSTNTFNFYVELGVTGTQNIRVFYMDGSMPVYSNAKTVTVKNNPDPPQDQCGDDATPPFFMSIPTKVASNQTFKVEGHSLAACGEVTLFVKQSGAWQPIGTDTPGPLSEVFYNVKQKVPGNKTQVKKAYMLSYTDPYDDVTVNSTVHKVVAYAP